MVDLTDTTKVSTMEGHEAPVLCVKFDPLTHYLVSNFSSSDVCVYVPLHYYFFLPQSSSSCDGTVKIWSVQTKVHYIHVHY